MPEFNVRKDEDWFPKDQLNITVDGNPYRVRQGLIYVGGKWETFTDTLFTHKGERDDDEKWRAYSSEDDDVGGVYDTL